MQPPTNAGLDLKAPSISSNAQSRASIILKRNPASSEVFTIDLSR